MKKNKLILFTMIIILFLLILREHKIQTTPTPVYALVNQKEKIVQESIVSPYLKKLNNRNKSINSFVCDQLTVRINKDGSHFKLKGEMFYEKDRNFRLRVYSLFGTELDMGSNDQQFWVWSKRMKPKSTMFFANHNDLYKTRLRTPFVPLWIMGVLGFNVIEPEKINIYAETNDYLVIAKRVISPTGESLIKKIYINKKINLIVAYHLNNLNGETITVTQIEYDNTNLKRIYIKWYEENIEMDFNFFDYLINTKVNPEIFELPDYKNKIDMGKD